MSFEKWNGDFIGDISSFLINEYNIGDQGDEAKEYKIGDQILIAIQQKVPEKNLMSFISKLKKALGLIPRGYLLAEGFHKTKKKEYCSLFYLEKNEKDEIIFELPLCSLVRNHVLKFDKKFREKLCDLIVFMDIFCLKSIGDKYIRIRKIGDEFYPVGYNEYKINENLQNFNSIVNKNFLSKWFDEKESYYEVIKRLMNNFEKNTGLKKEQFSDYVTKIAKETNSTWFNYDIVRRRILHFSHDFVDTFDGEASTSEDKTFGDVILETTYE